MPDFAINQTEVRPSDEQAPDVIRAEDLPSTATKRKHDGQDDGETDALTQKQPSNQDTATLGEGNLLGSSGEGASSITSKGATAAGKNDKKRQRRGTRGANPSDETTSHSAVLNTFKDPQEALDDGQVALDQFYAFQRDEDLDRCVESLKNAVALCQIGHPLRLGSFLSLGIALQVRFEQNGAMADLEEIICTFQEVLALLPIGHEMRSVSLSTLGTAFSARFDQKGNMDDLEESIRCNQESLSLCPIGHPGRSTALGSLGTALSRRFDQTGDMSDLEESINHLREALSLFPIDDPDRSEILGSLGDALRVRFEQAENKADLEESIQHHQAALLLCPIDHPGHSETLNNLGNALSTRFDWTRNMTDLEESVRYHQDALSLRPTGHPDRSTALRCIGTALYRRFKQTGDMIDLEKTIDYHREDLLLRPIGHHSRWETLSNLGNSLITRFDRAGDANDLEESVHNHKEALLLCPIGHPGRPEALNNLGDALNTRFEQTGDMADLEGSIFHHRKALSLCPTGHPGRSNTLNDLGNTLSARFDHTGNLADLEESMLYHQETLSLHPIDHPNRSTILNNLGNTLCARFERMGNMADLEGSTYYFREALSLCPIGHQDRSGILNNFGISLRRRFDRTTNMADLEESISHHREDLSLRHIGHPSRSATLNNLGTALSSRFDQTGDMVDLEESIRHRQEALSYCQAGHPDRSAILNNLGIALRTRFGQTGNVTDLEESIRHHQADILLCPDGHPARSSSLSGLGLALRDRFDLTGRMADLEESIHYHMDAVDHTLSPLTARLTSAHNWIIIALQNNLESLQDAYAAYMNLLDRSLLLAASSIHDAHSHMIQINSQGMYLAGDAASHAIEKNQLRTAVEIAERGRALLLTQLGGYRTALNGLDILNKQLAIRFRTLSTALEESFTLSPKNAKTNPGDEIARRQKIAADWDDTVEEIRQLKGFENFLGVTPFSTLQKAAVNGPVILVNISRFGSFALIITAAGDPLSVPLPEATPSVAIALANRLIESTTSDLEESKSNQNLTDILRDLWAMVVSPIVLQLEGTLHLPAGSRIWWMPTSAIWWLPLHAAGPYKSSERNLADRFISSYTPTLSSLIRSRTSYQPSVGASGPRMLVVAQATAEGQVALPNVEVEVDLIRQLRAQVTVIEGEACTRDSVLECLKDTAWIHFSCHGHQHPTEPFKSHFSVGTLDAPLTVLDIIRNGLPRAELAVLSACHSAAGEKTTPDEAINLAAGIQFAGFRSVVGTTWAMDDRDGPVMAQEFYKYMFRNGPEAVDCRDAAKALVMGIRALRQRKVPLERWINFVHYGI